MNIEEKIEKGKNLKELTTYKIGGDAKYFVAVKNEKELIAAVEWADGRNEKIFILGGGSNILVNDEGVSGLVIKPEDFSSEVRGERIEAGAGVQLAGVVLQATSHSLTGMEWAVGVPGTVGGAIKGNAGCFGSGIENVVETVRVFDMKKKKIVILSKRDCAFAYRMSGIKENRNLIIISATIKLKIGSAGDINERLAYIVNKRNGAYPKLPSAGSVFKNIYLDEIKKCNPPLGKKYEELNIARDGRVAAHWLIREAGMQGKVAGGAKVSLEHANFIVNTGKASAADVITLIGLIKTAVKEKFNVQLEEEIIYFGF